VQFEMLFGAGVREEVNLLLHIILLWTV